MATSKGVFACFSNKEEGPILPTNISEVHQVTVGSDGLVGLPLVFNASDGDGDRFAQYRRAFDAFDEDGDGFVTSSELSSYLRAMGIDPMKEEDLAKELHGNGFFSFGMFLESYYHLFKLNGDGCVDFEELKKMKGGTVISSQKMEERRRLWGWVTTVMKKLGLGKPAEDTPTSVIIKRPKY